MGPVGRAGVGKGVSKTGVGEDGIAGGNTAAASLSSRNTRLSDEFAEAPKKSSNMNKGRKKNILHTNIFLSVMATAYPLWSYNFL